VTERCTVLIASPDLLPALKQRTSDAAVELLAFSDADALRAIQVIIQRRPRVVVLERLFAATPRGAALINRMKADPSLRESEIRVISHEDDEAPVPGRQPGWAVRAAAAVAAALAPARTLDGRGTRRAPRVVMADNVDAVVDGNIATLVDLSIFGAQVMSPSTLKPNQRVRVVLPDDQGTVRFNGVVAWATFEIPANSGSRYRAGIRFVDADEPAVDAFCTRHQT
jgi:archaeosine-15-forming tRNA-guanine transglycosylase